MVTIRAATAADVPRINEIMNVPPGPEMLALVGDEAAASRFGKTLLELQHLPADDRPTFVADDDGRVVGFLQYTRGPLVDTITFGQLKAAIAARGPLQFVRGIPRLQARRRVDIPTPKDAFYIAEIHVDPGLRGTGIGGQLLDFADGEARRTGYRHLALHTHSQNPARALYERHGFVVTQVREDPRFQRYTGIRGRVLMEKWLD
jgi:ribosomal protein S18 acetylase RimI-like enzyme